MPAGLIFLADIYRITFNADDAAGGAQATGTVVYYNVQMRFAENKTEQLLLQQGLETTKTFTATVIPGTLQIYERDELKIVFPRSNIYSGDKFRIVDVQYSDYAATDPRGHIVLQLVRSVRAHTLQ